MSRRPPVITLASAVLAAAAFGLATWFGLSALAEPSGFEVRRGGLETTIARLERTADASRRRSVHAATAACPGLGENEVTQVKQDLLKLAGQAGATVTDLSAAPPTDLAGRGRLAPLSLRLQAVGPYETILALLEDLGDAQPEVFVDAVDLTTAAPDVKLKLTGKVFCWTSERP